jgi:hypothetical protein
VPDWSEVTAWATVALNGGVFVAVLSVRQDRRAADRSAAATRQATEQAKQAAREAREDARRQLEASYRPLLIEVLRNGPVTPDMEARTEQRLHAMTLPPTLEIEIGDAVWEPIDPRAVFVKVLHTEAIVSVPLRNIGRGLAVIKEGAVSLNGPVRSIDRVRVERPRVPPGETARITVSFTPSAHAEEATGFAVHVPYSDFAEGQATQAMIALSESSDGDWRVDHVEQLASTPRTA